MEKIYYIENGKLVESTLKDYINQYGTDWCTSPRGCIHRYFVEKVNNNEWGLYSWGVLGNNKYLVDTYKNEEEAEKALWDTKVRHLNKNYAPPYFNTPEEAYASYHEISVEVAKSILKKIKCIEEERKRRSIEAQKKVAMKIEKERERLNLSVDLVERTIEQFDKYKHLIEEKIKRNNRKISVKQANSIAWNVSKYFTAGVHFTTLRKLILKNYRQL